MRGTNILALFATLGSLFTSPMAYAENPEDKLLWLEDNKSPKVEAWVKEENERTVARFAHNPEYESRLRISNNILTDEQKLDSADFMNGFAYQIHREKGTKEGIWRRKTWSDYTKKVGKWETILDIDEMNIKENSTLSFAYSSCAKPKFERCAIAFSNAGSDARTLREFDLKSKSFVKDGFNFPFSMSSYIWIDENSVLLADGLANENQTYTALPRVWRLWKRGQKAEDSQIVYQGTKDDTKVFASTYSNDSNDSGEPFILLGRTMKGAKKDRKIYRDGKLIAFNVPDMTHAIGISEKRLIIAADVDSKRIKPGTILAIPLDNDQMDATKAVELWRPKEKQFLQTAFLMKGNLYLTMVENIQNRVIKLAISGNQVKESPINLPEGGIIDVYPAGENSDVVKIIWQSSLIPTRLYFYNDRNDELVKFSETPASFNASNLERKQYFAKSKDGTLIPYFVIGKKGFKLDSKNPTQMMGYGGFGQIMIPIYMKLSGKLWLEKGGVFIFTNLRGGGEYGDEWHKAGQFDKKQNVFDDFIAVAEDVIAKKITSARHLGIGGGSNGGLLVAAAMVQRPDLFRAVIAESPVLDMLKFHKMGSGLGTGWIPEYGNPEDPKDALYLRKYSPLHNLKEGVKYPEIFFMTAGNDDRVDPAHARKMAERLKELKQPYLYLEAKDGGHFNGNFQSVAASKAMGTTFMWDKLGPDSKD
ncbi:MAG: S9 family peptidase [Proteobacteria bacterium]|nr:MAG: S9 family peptidase [Pseudomonadota bacterium]